MVPGAEGPYSPLTGLGGVRVDKVEEKRVEKVRAEVKDARKDLAVLKRLLKARS